MVPAGLCYAARDHPAARAMGPAQARLVRGPLILLKKASEMASASPAPSGAMESQGAYNRDARLQASGGALAMARWTEAIERVALDDSDRAIVVADYGSSQGRNSFGPLEAAISHLRPRVGAERPILTYHVDLPANDFNALFAALDDDPTRYAPDDGHVFPCAVGRSFYDRVLPPDYVDLGWSAYAAQWLSRIPCVIPGHFFSNGADAQVRAAFKRQGALDWERFLRLRALELRRGGRLLVVVPVLNENGEAGIDGIMHQTNEVLIEMVGEGTLTAAERARMVVGVVAPHQHEMLAPFNSGKNFSGLSVEHCETHEVVDPAWLEYERDGDRDALARAHARFVRSAFAPTLALALDGSGSLGVNTFSERLELRLSARRAHCPAPIHTRVGSIVLVKQ
jgi:hypothetical protein